MSVDSINSVGSPYSPYNSVTQSLTSGKQINSSADNAAGLAVATGMTTEIMGQSMGMRNANDGMSLLQTADGATRGMTASVQRMYELSVQAMNGTLNASQRNMLNQEFQQNLQEINRTASTTKFNDISLLDGANPQIDIALGDSKSTLNLPTLTSDALGLTGMDITDPANAGTAMEALLNATDMLSTSQAEFGAQQNGLYSAVSNMATEQQNAYASRSQIMDTDFARASTDRARNDVLMQASIMMQAQGNQDKSNVLQLLG
jgi:flagellin